MRNRARIILLCCLPLAAGCGQRTEADSPAESRAASAVRVRTRAVETRVFPDELSVPGRWRAGGEAVLAAPFAAVVESIAVLPGDAVAAGQALAWLDTRESHAALRGAESLVRQARDAAARQEAAQAVELARRDLVRVPVRAPRAGVVLRRSVEPGTLVAESAEILAITPLNALVFEAHVPAALRPRLRPGQQAVIACSGEPPRNATLERILPAASEADQAVLAWLVPAPGAGPRPFLDRFGTATLQLGPPRRGLAVPDSAVVEDDVTGEKRLARVSPDGRAVWVPVTLGLRAGGWTELQAPLLTEGTPVIVEGQHGLPDSAKVQSVP